MARQPLVDERVVGLDQVDEAAIVAHEFGHDVQYELTRQLSIEAPQQPDSELIADCFAGVWASAVFDDGLLAEAERNGLRVTHVLETHTHADHVSGHGRLALEHGIPVAVHREAGAAYPHDPLEDGDEVTVGAVTVRTIHTPGHRPEHCCLAVVDRTRADEPWLVLTGDSLFVGDAARPDLAVGAMEGAEGLFHSLRRLLELGDGVEVFPGHVAGSLCGKAMSSKGSTTIGFERRFNPALQFASKAAFVRYVLADLPAQPEAFAENRRHNLGQT